jgi:hypothetical protein
MMGRSKDGGDAGGAEARERVGGFLAGRDLLGEAPETLR